MTHLNVVDTASRRRLVVPAREQQVDRGVVLTLLHPQLREVDVPELEVAPVDPRRLDVPARLERRPAL